MRSCHLILYFSKALNLRVHAGTGDQTAHLWWRVLHGAVFERHQPKLSIILIGGNDLEAAAECGEGSAVIAAAVPQMVSRCVLDHTTKHAYARCAVSHHQQGMRGACGV